MSYDATVITPFSWAGEAVELGNRQWRKKILPVGDVAYQGRMLHFTRDYLGKLAEAFRSRAYDQVPFQLADAKNTHTNDPERTRGQILDLELADDGLWALAEVTERGEQVLRDNPYLGVSARIVENYARSDGKFYPAAIQHVLGTLDPRIPQLGSWQPVDMANDGELIIDLSQSAWDGEPGPSWELAASAVGARLGQDLDPYLDIDGIIAASLPTDDGYAELAEFSQAWEDVNALELARLTEDAEPLAVRTEDRIARALERIEAGTFTPRVYGFAAPGEGSTSGMPTCGPAGDFGYCMNRHHDPSCGSTADTFVAESLRPQMADLAHRPHLDEDGLPWIDAEFGSMMTLTDHVEAMTGIRLGDADPYAVRPRRELIAAARTQVWGDPDDPDSVPMPFSADTAATAAALAAQSGISTYASTAPQRDAYRAEHARQAARLGTPRHADFRADLSNPVTRERGLAAFGDEPWNGSLQTYSRAGAA
jgi:hypothetical protein